MSTIQFNKDDVKAYLDKCIVHWREQASLGDPCARYYIDAFQSMRMALFDETLPGDPDPAGISAIYYRHADGLNALDKMYDELLNTAVTHVREQGFTSISILQRTMKIGYTQAARLIEKMEYMGIIGAPDPTSYRRLFIDNGGGHVSDK